MSVTAILSVSSQRRLGRARAWLENRGKNEEVLLIGATLDAANELARAAARQEGAAFGWHRLSIPQLASAVAAPLLATRGLVPITRAGAEAVVAALLHRLRAEGKLSRYESVADAPGFPRAIGEVIAELRIAQVQAADLESAAPDLVPILRAYEQELSQSNFVDWAGVLQHATEAAKATRRPRLIALPTLLLDVSAASAAEFSFINALAAAAPELMATMPAADSQTLARFRDQLGSNVEDLDALLLKGQPAQVSGTALARLQRNLFKEREASLSAEASGDEIEVFSAPGEGRECVEIVRRVLALARDGVPFDRIAVLLRSPADYRAHLQEAFSRADIPVHFARGAVRPDPAGRAFYALLKCAGERLSARRFAEYLSLGQVPDATIGGQPPESRPRSDLWVSPDPELVSQLAPENPDDVTRSMEAPAVAAAEAPVVDGQLRAPRRWERLLVEAAVIGGRDRWRRRIDGLANELRRKLAELGSEDETKAAALSRAIDDLAAFAAYALPLVAELDDLPAAARWGEWLDRLGSLATRTLKMPDRVLAILAEIAPIAPVGPVGLNEVMIVLESQLLEASVPPSSQRYGRVFIGPIDAARGLSFDAVFVPGVAEKMFPRKIVEEPILLDVVRGQLKCDLATNETRLERERLALALAAGAAERRIFFSYPRIDLDKARPRVASFYALEAMRSAEGRLPDFAELARRAEAAAFTRLGWPAPTDPDTAIDDAEHDLAVLDGLMGPSEQDAGQARYLLTANPYLARALRSRYQRWSRHWTSADGLLNPSTAIRRVLNRHRLGSRSYSPTALQGYARCPYRFFLQAVQGLAPREVPAPIDELDPLQRGSLIHDVQFALFARLRQENLLPVRPARLDRARQILEEVTTEVAAWHKDDLAPAIDRVWENGVAAIRADLREWLRRASVDDSGFIPRHFELSFGLAHRSDRDAADPASVAEAVNLDCGIQLRGSIDLVERHPSGLLRVTDHKTGKSDGAADQVIDGGRVLQPVLYALAAEKLFVGDDKVTEGRLYFCTSVGGFSQRAVALDERARKAAAELAVAVGAAIEEPFLPAAPGARECENCDYRSVCGPYEEYRVGRKPQGNLARLSGISPMAVTALSDDEARSRILTEYGTTFFVEAAAGTGKTTALVGRIVGLIRGGSGTLARTVAVTFTEKAAGEMKLRLRLEIERARATATAEERGRLDHALEELELARIGTIHAFCGDLLSERPVEAGVDPLFKMVAEDEAYALVDEAFEAWLQRILADPPEGPRRVLRRRSGWESPREQLRTAMHTLCDHRDFPAPWRRDPFDRNGAIDALLEELAEIGELAETSSWPEDPLARNLREIARFVLETTRLEAVSGRDYDGIEAELRELARNRRRFKGWDYKGSAKTVFGDLARDEVMARRDGVRSKLEDFIAASDADLAPLIHQALQSAIADYELLKSRSGCLDFLDLLIKARNLVRDHDGVRRELQDRFSHFFVDEFQDTDPLQAEILLLLAADEPGATDWRAARPVAGKLFLVGDPKQSIYRFRRADVALYEDVKTRLLGAGAELLHLSTSFRAPPSIQRFINDAFAPAIAADAEASGYVVLEPCRPEATDRPTIVALPVPRPYGDFGKITDYSINESLPGAVGAFVDWLINDSKWTVEEDGRTIPIRPRHVALLFRRFRSFRTDITRPYVRALEARRISHVLVGGRSFHDREEIIALRNAITAIEWPDDELKVFATLRGPFFALDDEALLLYRQRIDGEGTLAVRRLNPMQRVDRAELDPAAAEVADALEVLRRLHVGRNRRPVAETITIFLRAVRAHAGIALWQNGEQALANCQRLVDMARHFEHRASSFRAFVESVEDDAEEGSVDEAPIVEEGTEGVRVMTVYKAKGLEFPVVILADPTYKAVRATPTRHIDSARSAWFEPLCGAMPIELREVSDLEARRDQAEAIRVAYVAATRARDLLVVPACGDEPIEGWYDVLDPVLYPAENSRRKSSAAPGCPSFGEESVIERGPKGKPPPAGSVRPGLHLPAPDGGAVVWWDPAILRLEVDELAPLRHQRLLEPNADGATASESQRNYEAWKGKRASLLEKASEPALAVRTITAHVHAASAGERAGASDTRGQPDVHVEHMDRGHLERPGGRRFGVLVHALLASVDLRSDAGAVQAAASVQGKIVGATEEEIAAAASTIGHVLDHPILRRAAAKAGSGAVRRETPVLLTLEDGSILEGVADLAFRDEEPDFSGWTVVDFKTGREVEASLDAYVAQVQLYSKAVATATDAPARGILLVI